MKFHCKNELSLLSFDEAVVKEFKIEKLFRCKIIRINYKTDLKLILEINIWD